MTIFVCPKCYSTDIYIRESAMHKGLYCSSCGAWITWLSKANHKIAECQIMMLQDSIASKIFNIKRKENQNVLEEQMSKGAISDK